jgi:hypothetical protein
MKKVLILLTITMVSSALSQPPMKRPPVIDMHLHTGIGPEDPTSPEMKAYRDSTLDTMDSLNVRIAVVSGLQDAVTDWYRAAPSRLIPGVLFPCDRGKAVLYGGLCFHDGKDFPDPEWLRGEIKSGRVKALGEIVAEYFNMAPDDAQLEPYYLLAEKYDIPVMIHIGLGPPNAAYEENPAPYKAPNFHTSVGRPLLLENALLRHPKMRVSVMHAGWPFGDEMVTILYHHPHVYVDTGVLQLAIPRAEYYNYLKRIIQAGYANRIMFGSDGGSAEIRSGIKAIEDADFLTDQQKRDILYNNAVRFLRLEEKDFQ